MKNKLKLPFFNALNHKKRDKIKYIILVLVLTIKWIVFTEAETISTFEKGTGIEGLGGTLIL